MGQISIIFVLYITLRGLSFFPVILVIFPATTAYFHSNQSLNRKKHQGFFLCKPYTDGLLGRRDEKVARAVWRGGTSKDILYIKPAKTVYYVNLKLNRVSVAWGQSASLQWYWYCMMSYYIFFDYSGIFVFLFFQSQMKIQWRGTMPNLRRSSSRHVKKNWPRSTLSILVMTATNAQVYTRAFSCENCKSLSIFSFLIKQNNFLSQEVLSHDLHFGCNQYFSVDMQVDWLQ